MEHRRILGQRKYAVCYHNDGCMSLRCCLVIQSCPTLLQSHGFSRQEYWSGLPFPSPGDPSDPGIEPASLALAGEFFPLSHQGSPHVYTRIQTHRICNIKSEPHGCWIESNEK